jgi:hypothetical protein
MLAWPAPADVSHLLRMRAQHNLEGVLGFALAAEDYARIAAIGFQLRLVDGIRFLRPEGPFRCAAPSLLYAWPCSCNWSLSRA